MQRDNMTFKKGHVGLIIIGSIFALIGAYCTYIHISGLIILGPALIMIALGIVFTVIANKNNNKICSLYHDKILSTTCIYCGHPVSTNIYRFRLHRRYPEGFIYCPVCKKPLSRYAFHAEQINAPVASSNKQINH